MTAPEDGCSEASTVSATGAAMVAAGGVSSSFTAAAGSEELSSASGTAGEGEASSPSAVRETKKRDLIYTFYHVDTKDK